MTAEATYDAYAERLVASGVLRNPWIDGLPRFRPEPVVLDASRWAEARRAAEQMAAASHAMVGILMDEPRLVDEVLGLTPFQRAMWTASAPSWHGMARADVFFTDDGVAIAEINCDTPTGQAEAVVLGRLATEGDGHPGTVDPTHALRERFLAMLEHVGRRERVARAGPLRTVGLVYPTELTDDLPLVRLYKQWLEERGWAVVLGSPFNLTFAGGRTRLFDTPINLLLRHYKTDWWGERTSVWLDDPIGDDQPLAEPFRAVLSGMAEGTLAVVNPFGAVVPQNKRSLALMWERIHRFPGRAGQHRALRPGHAAARADARRAARGAAGAVGHQERLRRRGRGGRHRPRRQRGDVAPGAAARAARPVGRAAVLPGRDGRGRRVGELRRLPRGRTGGGAVRESRGRSDGREGDERAGAREGA